MKNRVLAAGLLAGACLGLPALAFAHGGQYRGPGDTVPPGGGGRGGSGPASGGSPGLGGTGTGPGSGTGGPGVPGGPGGVAGLGPPVTGGGAAGPDLSSWTFWWEFNKHPYLDLKAHVHADEPLTGSDRYFLGFGQRGQAKDSLAPSDPQVENVIVPALLLALETESDDDVVTACMIALAKIGDAKGEDGSSRFEELFLQRLRAKSQEVRETAVLALGILANDSGVAPLAALLRDDAGGRALVGRGEVGYRTRSFAAYGLSLIGARTGDPEVRRTIVTALADVLRNDRTKARDLSVACVIAVGLVPVEPALAPAAEAPGDREAPAPVDPARSRAEEIEFVLAVLRDGESRSLVRAHAPTALARLLTGLPAERAEEFRERVAEELLRRVDGRLDEPDEITQGCVLGLGLLGDMDGDSLDQRIRSTLMKTGREHAGQEVRNFALIALARIAERRGGGVAPDAGLEETARHLLWTLSAGKKTLRPWAGLALGVLGERAVGEPSLAGLVGNVSAALRASFDEEKSGERLGAYAIASGILRDAEAVDPLLDRLRRIRDDEARGYLAVALGLIGERRAVEDIRAVVREAKYRPELLRQAAIGLGLLGDKELVGDLTAMLAEAKGLATQAALASALGLIGDARSVDPLVAMLEDRDLTGLARAFAAVALGIVADKEPLPWNAKLGVDLNYPASTATLNDPGGKGVLNIL